MDDAPNRGSGVNVTLAGMATCATDQSVLFHVCLACVGLTPQNVSAKTTTEAQRQGVTGKSSWG